MALKAIGVERGGRVGTAAARLGRWQRAAFLKAGGSDRAFAKRGAVGFVEVVRGLA